MIEKENNIYKVNLLIFLSIVISFIYQILPFELGDGFYQYICFLLPAGIYLLVNKKNIIDTLNIKPLKLKNIPYLIMLYVFLLPFRVMVIYIYTVFFEDKLSKIIGETIVSNPSLLENLFIVVLTPIICEEILMRGIVLDGYRKKSIHIVAVMNGLIFGMLHMNSFQFIDTFFVGIVLTYVVYVTGSIFSSMIIHGINNGMALFMEYFDKGQDTLEPIKEGAEASLTISFSGFLIYAGVVLICVFMIYKIIKKLIKINNFDYSSYTTSRSDEKIFNWPLIVTIILFLIMSALLILTINYAY
ncbi:lysostaphin resistance A-like protein [Clostridium sp.]|uniref:lysostaphin resistance A-like protein n=1 Tax=Clostridium sp. TaxID=1506 RepID=UPI00346406E1